jgi:hypothetical protein
MEVTAQLKRSCPKCGNDIVYGPRKDVFKLALKRNSICNSCCHKRPLEKRFWQYVTKTPTCWLWTGAKTTYWEYGEISVNRIPTGAHRVSWELHNGPIPEGMCVCHHCDNPPCVNPSHLFLGTRLDNTRDMDRKGRRITNNPFGIYSHHHKLNEAQVRAIKVSTNPQRQCAKEFGISKTQVKDIRDGKSWPHIK